MKKGTKAAALVLAMTMAMSFLTACGGDADKEAKTASTEATADTAGTETADENGRCPDIRYECGISAF